MLYFCINELCELVIEYVENCSIYYYIIGDIQE